jgi:hypothetical protein
MHMCVCMYVCSWYFMYFFMIFVVSKEALFCCCWEREGGRVAH